MQTDDISRDLSKYRIPFRLITQPLGPQHLFDRWLVSARRVAHGILILSTIQAMLPRNNLWRQPVIDVRQHGICKILVYSIGTSNDLGIIQIRFHRNTYAIGQYGMSELTKILIVVFRVKNAFIKPASIGLLSPILGCSIQLVSATKGDHGIVTITNTSQIWVII